MQAKVERKMISVMKINDYLPHDRCLQVKSKIKIFLIC